MQTFLRFFIVLTLCASLARADDNLISNGDLSQKSGLKLTGGATHTYLGDTRRDMSSNGVALRFGSDQVE